MAQPLESSSGRQDILGTPQSTPLVSISELFPNIERNFSIRKGKVRDSVDLGDKLLFVATDRISVFDVVLPNGIPQKGVILNQMTRDWLDLLGGLTPNHFITVNTEEFPEPFNNPSIQGRSVLVKKLRMMPTECIVRGYITGSALVEYMRIGAVCGISLPSGMVESQKLDKPIFTPSTKAIEGHDENIDFETMVALIHESFPSLNAEFIAGELRRRSLTLYQAGADYARSRGIIIADTKFEFGIDDEGKINLGDEVLTPDSSRFWPAEDYKPGRSQNSFDKQYVRDYVTSIGWDRQPPAPYLPDDIVEKTREKYLEAQLRLFGQLPFAA